VTNPNDILDAYDELVRLVDTLGADTIRSILDRACERTTVEPEPAVRWLEPIGKVVNSTNDLTGLVVDIELNENGIEIAKRAGFLKSKSSPPVSPTSETTCPWCGIETTKNTMFRHLNNTHRADLEQLYVDDGIKGIQDVFALPYQTAYGWACKLDGEAA